MPIKLKHDVIAKKATQAALKVGSKVMTEQAEFDVEKELNSIAINGEVNMRDLVGDPEFWDSDAEQMTPAGQTEYHRRAMELAEERVGFSAAESLADFNGADQTAQAEAFNAYAQAMGLNTSKSYSTGGSRYVEVDIGGKDYKFRFANHFNTTRDSTMQPDFNVAPGRNDFTEAIAFIDEKINSGGARQTDTPAFKKWFAGSKVVDAQGKPLRTRREPVWGVKMWLTNGQEVLIERGHERHEVIRRLKDVNDDYFWEKVGAPAVNSPGKPAG